MSSSPKNCWKKGSLKNGEVRCRTICTEEILATACTVASATRVKSAPAAGTIAGRAGVEAATGAAGCAGCATRASSLRTCPEMTRPAISPAVRNKSANEKRFIEDGSTSGDVDPARPLFGGLGKRDRENAVTQVRGDALGVDQGRQRKGARELTVAALDLVILLARH